MSTDVVEPETTPAPAASAASAAPGPTPAHGTDTGASAGAGTVHLGTVYLPKTGTGVGRFSFVVDSETGGPVEIGTPVAADTREGTVVGTVMDARTVGTATDPVAHDMATVDLGDRQAADTDVIVADVQVFHSPRMRPVSAGIVRSATADEVRTATGYDRMDWPVPAGVVPLADGSFAKVAFDGTSLLGPESAHLIVGGLSGMASKTSYIGTLVASAIAAGSPRHHSVGALIFNVKGEDLIYMDAPPAEGYELTEEDRAIYAALGVPAEPFKNVTVYAPSLPAAAGTRSPRADALPLRWDLAMVWRYLRYLLPFINDDEKLSSFIADFENRLLYNPNEHRRVDTFGKLRDWFDQVFEEAAGTEGKENPTPWGSHHIMTLRRIRRMLENLVPRCAGLLTMESSRPGDDVPVTGWEHGQVIVVDLAGLSVDVQALAIGRTLERVLRSAEAGELGVEHLIVVADELNEFAPAQGAERSGVRSVLRKVATQGRYAGVSLFGAAQKLSKVDELVRDNAATRALGRNSEGEISSGVYGRMPAGVSERVVSLPKGWMSLNHYAFRGELMVRFPRPAWRTGKPKTAGAAARPKTTDALGLSARSTARLMEGVPAEVAERLIAGADSAEAAQAALAAARVPDVRTVRLDTSTGFDPSNPFDLD